ncbi:MAG: rhodanese family protein [Hyphomonadaceae bacterium]|nr:rhodanese family protein [Hyphomonadaceae bacterium]
MTTLTPIKPTDLAERLRRGQVTLVDIREPDEFAREHIAGAVSVPLSRLEQGRLLIETKGDVVFHCRSGKRTDANCARLAAHIDGPAFMLEGGLDAWKAAAEHVVQDRNAPLELNRQVQIAAGLLILSGVIAGALLHPAFYALSAFVGAGLTFAGVSGWCGMAHLLAIAPWNRRAA